MELAGDQPDATLAARMEAEIGRARSYDALLATVPDLAYLFDLKHRLIYANQATLTLWRKSWEEAAGKTCRDLGYPDWHAAMHEREMDEVIATRRPIKGEVPFQGADGRRIHEYIFVPITGLDGKVEAVGGTTRDVTERKEREERDNFLVALSDALHYVGNSTEIMNVACHMLGSRLGVDCCGYGELDEAGECFQVKGGWTENERLHRIESIRLRDLGPRLLEDIRAGRTVQLKNGLPASFVDEATDLQDGVAAIVSGIGVPLIKDRRLIAIFYVHQVTPCAWTADEVMLVEEIAQRSWEAVERARAEEALRHSENRLRALMAASSEVTYSMSADGHMMRQLHGKLHMDRPEAPTRIWVESFVHPDDQRQVLAAIDDAIAQERVLEVACRVRREGDTPGWVFTRAVPLRNDDGEIVEWFGSTTDITSRKEAEIGLEEASRAKDEFLAMLGHELRNPLAPIVTTLELMRAREPDALTKERAMITKQVKHMVGLVDDLLDVSRIARGKIELKRAPVDLADIVAQAVETVHPLIEKNRQTLRTAVDEGLVVDGDARRLVQVVTNLLTNAAKYSPRDATTHLHACAEDGTAVLRVRDEGIGIDAPLLPNVFELFTQSEQSIDRSEGGLGLGLALVKNLVGLHGGSVEAQSEGRNRGSEFIVRVPLAGTRQAESDQRPAEADNPAVEDVPDRLRVLIVDDYRDAAESLAELLEMDGFLTKLAYDGAAGIEAAAKFRPAVALIDIGLPVMDGYEVARCLRRTPEVENIVLIATTGYGQDRDSARARRAGFDAHLVKPMDPATVGDVIRQQVEMRSAPSVDRAI